jgi:hypothetical protein
MIPLPLSFTDTPPWGKWEHGDPQPLGSLAAHTAQSHLGQQPLDGETEAQRYRLALSSLLPAVFWSSWGLWAPMWLYFSYKK